MKKKILVFGICLLFCSLTLSSTVSASEIVPEEWTGEITGSIGYGNGEGWQEVATMDGNYKEGQRAGFFHADVIGSERSGSISGYFGRHMIVGRITGDQGRLPFIGFIRINQQNNTFVGRAMAPVGPALYFAGTFAEL